MSYKIDMLLKQASLFEKLATHGNRRAYLQALAQGWDDIMRQEGDLPTTGIPAPPAERPVSPPPPNLPPPPAPPQAKQPRQLDKPTVELLQMFLNNSPSLRKSVISGQRSPLVVDGIMGPDTLGVLKEWGKTKGIGQQDIQSLINTALTQAKNK